MNRYWAVHKIDSDDPNTLIVGQDRFRLLAALIPLAWALWHRQWRWGVFLIGLSLALAATNGLAGTELVLVNGLGFAINIWYGFEAENLRLAEYLRLGYTELDPIHATSYEEAELYALEKWNHRHTATALTA